MVEKKNAKQDTRRYRGLFFNIGLVVSLGLVLMAFEWKTPVPITDVELPFSDEGIVIMETPPTYIPPPPKPKVEVIDQIIEKEDEVEIEDLDLDLDIFTDETSDIKDPVFVDEIPEEKVETVYFFVEKQPKFNGKDQSEFIKYISSKLKYPDLARRIGVEGKVFAQFIVDKDGSMTDIQIIKGIGAGCDEEVLRVLKEAPKWEPGKQQGVPVKVSMIIPVTFTLNR